MLNQPRLETNSCFSSGTQGHQKHGPVMHHLHHTWGHKGQLRLILTNYLAKPLVRFYPTDWMLLYRGKPQRKQDHPTQMQAITIMSLSDYKCTNQTEMRSASWVRIVSSRESADHREIELFLITAHQRQ